MPGFLSPGTGLPFLLIPEYSGINKEQRILDRSKRAHRKPPVKCFLTFFYHIDPSDDLLYCNPYHHLLNICNDFPYYHVIIYDNRFVQIVKKNPLSDVKINIVTYKNHISSIYRMGIQGPNSLSQSKTNRGDFMDPINTRH